MVTKEVTSKIKLINSEIIVDGIAGEFDPKKYFIENGRGYSIGRGFEEQVLAPAKTISNLPIMKFSEYQFTDSISDKEIMERFRISLSSRLMLREEILWVIAYLTSRKQQQIFLNNTIIGYFTNNNLTLSVVAIHKDTDIKKFRLQCYLPGISGPWGADFQMLFRR